MIPWLTHRGNDGSGPHGLKNLNGLYVYKIQISLTLPTMAHPFKDFQGIVFKILTISPYKITRIR